MSNYALTNCRIIDGIGTGIQENMSILVSGGNIKQLGKVTEVKIPKEYNKLDLKGNYVMPGLINAHAHLFGSGKPMKAISGGKSQEKLVGLLKTALGRKILDRMVKDHVMAALNSGVTTIRAVGDLFYSDVKIRDQIDSGNFSGPRLLVAGKAISVTGGHGSGSFAAIADSPWEARKAVRMNVHEQVDLIKICVTGGVTDSRVIGQAGRLAMTLEEVSAVCEEAHKIGFLVAAHAESTEGVRLALQGGVDTIEHGSEFDQEIIELFLNNPKSLRGYSSLIPTLYPAITICKLNPNDTLMSPVNVENSNIVFEGMVKGLINASKAGVLIGLGTDASCPFVTQYNTWRELDYTVRYAGLTPEMAIQNATRNNARILGIDHITGTIEPKKAADLIVVKENPLTNLRGLSQVQMVMRGELMIDKPIVKKLSQVEELLDTI
ncbi:amidohydrolase family protein [Anaerocolumna sp. AGMB13025]|uniref:amidohydrolase family protein n=1 Tax=Anaerocolumna sp. AGMB13025 TaxID=3039116 RepID=UPI00241F603E|nr:amidohydrolase family protein [Anaerocolumna sp. AGMB13025]WFR59099.1 amidohydrolase family protein [Anaerocolumna sp. AGMB13025]